jgi:hypothetical protein
MDGTSAFVIRVITYSFFSLFFLMLHQPGVLIPGVAWLVGWGVWHFGEWKPRQGRDGKGARDGDTPKGWMISARGHGHEWGGFLRLLLL